MKSIVYIIFMETLRLISTEKDGGSHHQKEFDYPTLFYNHTYQMKPPTIMDDQTLFQPLIALKRAMGPLPARLPPIYYLYKQTEHAPYEGDSSIIFQRSHQMTRLNMDDVHQHEDTPQLPMAGQQSSQSQLIQVTSNKQVRKSPVSDSNEGNLWLKGGFNMAALILKSLGENVQSQGSSLERIKRKDNRNPSVLLNSDLINSAEKNMCLELTACLQPHWAQFYIDNLRKINNDEKLATVLSRIEIGTSTQKHDCRIKYKCHRKETEFLI